VARRRKTESVDSGPTAEDLHYGRLAVLYMLSTEDPPVFRQLNTAHDHREPYTDPALERRALRFAKKWRHIWTEW
jgi:hypothetical protein